MEDTDKMIDEQPVPNKKDETNNMNETKNSVDEITKDENTKADECDATLEDKEKRKSVGAEKSKIERRKKISGLKQSSKTNSDLVPSNETKEDDGEYLIFQRKLMWNFVF